MKHLSLTKNQNQNYLQSWANDIAHYLKNDLHDPHLITLSCTGNYTPNEALDDFDDLNAIILGVSADSTKSHRNFIAKQNLDLTLLSDPTTQMMQAYEVWALKKNYGKEYMGIVRSTYIIDPDGVIQAAWTNVKVKDHAKSVQEMLKSLQP